jgi:hypothetical protein
MRIEQLIKTVRALPLDERLRFLAHCMACTASECGAQVLVDQLHHRDDRQVTIAVAIDDKADKLYALSTALAEEEGERMLSADDESANQVIGELDKKIRAKRGKAG